MTEYAIHLPTPHETQAEFIASTAKRKVIAAGRRGGKTTGAAMLAVEGALDGRRVLEAAPTAEQTSAFWDCVTDYLREPIAAKVVYKHETKRLLKLPNGGVIRCKTANNADALRGDWGDLVILDEYQLMSPDVFDKVVAPMMLDTNGDTVFIGSPLRRNHFHKAHARGVADGDRWQSWHFTSLENPHLSEEALQEITFDMTREAYKQEILAEFLEGEGAVFRNIAACLNAPPSTPEQHEGHRIVIGADWGKQADFTSLSVGCVDCKQELELDRFNKIDYVFQVGRLSTLYRRWGAIGVLPERNSIGEPVIEQIEREGLDVISGPDDKPGFMTTGSTKPPLIENLALALERTEWQLLPDEIGRGELEAYERRISVATGRSAYSAPAGLHDDTVIARALMLRAAYDMDANWLIY